LVVERPVFLPESKLFGNLTVGIPKRNAKKKGGEFDQKLI
jgi:hypothetical protein